VGRKTKMHKWAARVAVLREPAVHQYAVRHGASRAADYCGLCERW
jgi:hypothetical protein